ncbi:MAG: phosphotransferase [Proteobacteria bacterium]|nr:phosphotransferase [Pseudomonadota bacterium]
MKTPALFIRDKVRATAEAQGQAGSAWLAQVDELVATIAAQWNLTLGAQLTGGTASVVVAARTADGEDAALKVAVPGLDPFAGELRTLLAANGRGYARVLRHDRSRDAMLLERLGPRLAELGFDADTQIEALCATLKTAWRSLPEGEIFTTGAQKARDHSQFIAKAWAEFGKPCSERTIERARDYAAARERAFDPETAVLAHGDAHAWNTLVVPGSEAKAFKFVDPDGLFVERAYDLSISLRELSAELVAGDEIGLGHRRCRQLAHLTGVATEAIWQWGLLECASNGLLYVKQGMPDVARQFLAAADAWAKGGPP